MRWTICPCGRESCNPDEAYCGLCQQEAEADAAEDDRLSLLEWEEEIRRESLQG